MKRGDDGKCVSGAGVPIYTLGTSMRDRKAVRGADANKA